LNDRTPSKKPIGKKRKGFLGRQPYQSRRTSTDIGFDNAMSKVKRRFESGLGMGVEDLRPLIAQLTVFDFDTGRSSL